MRNFLHAGESMAVRFALLLVVFFGLGLSRPGFNPQLGAWGLLVGSAVVGLLGIAIATTMVAGELDLSVAAVAGVSAILTVQLLDVNPLLAVLAGAAVGGAIGALQGAGIWWLKMSSLVFTLGISILLGGVQLIMTPGGESIIANDLGTTQTMTQRFVIFTPVVIIFLTAAALYQLFLSFSRFGTELYAFGGHRKEAILAGVNQRKMMVSAFALSGLFAGLAGAMSALSSASATPNQLAPLLLTAVTVALLGGVGLHGGVGRPMGVVVGTLLLVSVTNALAIRGVSSDAQNLAIGGLLLATILLQLWIDRSKRRRLDKIESLELVH